MSWLLDLSKFYRLKSRSTTRASEISWNTEINRATSTRGCECYREQLSAMIDGELAPADVFKVESHLEGCAECRRELEGLNEYHASIHSLAEVETPGSLLGSIQEALRQEALRTGAAEASCSVIGSLLSAYIDSEITLTERERVQVHTASCRACAAQLKALRRTSRLLGALPSIEPPADLRAQVLARTSRRSYRAPAFSVASAGLLAAVAICIYFYPVQPAEPGASGSDTQAVQTASRNAAPVGIAAGIANGSVRGLARPFVRSDQRLIADRPLIAVRPVAIRSTSGAAVPAGATFSPSGVFRVASAGRAHAIQSANRASGVLAPESTAAEFKPTSPSKQHPRRAHASHVLSSGAEFIPDSVRADPAVSWPESEAPAALASGAASRASASGGAPNNPIPTTIAMRPSEPDNPAPFVQAPTVNRVAPGTANLSPTRVPDLTPPSRHSEMVLASVQQSDLTEGVWSEDQTARNQRWTQTANLMVESNLHSSRLMSARARGASRSINGSPVLTAAASRPFQF